LTPALLAEIKSLLGRSDIRHGMAFRGMELGITAEQLATQWDRSVSHARSIMRSVQYVLDGELPTASAMAYTNSFAYRELWELGASPELMKYIKSCLHQLAERNPEVKIEPMGAVTFPGESPRSKHEKSVAVCPQCFLTLPCDCSG